MSQTIHSGGLTGAPAGCAGALLAVLLLSVGDVSRGEEAFVRVSPRDSRYFELSDGRPYVPIGLNTIAPPRDGGLDGMEAWFARLSAGGGNYVRIWLGHQFFDVEHARSGQYDPKQAERIDPADAQAYDPWTDRWTPVTVRDGRIPLPAFSRSIVVRVRRSKAL